MTYAWLRSVLCALVVAALYTTPSTAAAAGSKCERVVRKGDTVSRIARSVGVSEKNLIAANKSLAKNPNRLRVGQKLDICRAKRLQTSRPQACEGGGRVVTHTVGRGETLGAIAARYSVSQKSLRRHNKRLAKRARGMIRVGEQLRVCTELRRYTHRSWLKEGVQLAEGEGYHVRRPGNAFGTKATVEGIVAAIARYREADPDAPLVQIGDISRENGGPLREHLSHQEGRDADIGYVYSESVEPDVGKKMDLGRTWVLLRSFADDDNVAVVFVDYGLQKRLYAYAQSIGIAEAELDRLFEYPRGDDGEAVFYHWPGHTGHFHVRFGKVRDEPDDEPDDDEPTDDDEADPAADDDVDATYGDPRS
jgi:LysM repeat protein